MEVFLPSLSLNVPQTILPIPFARLKNTAMAVPAMALASACPYHPLYEATNPQSNYPKRNPDRRRCDRRAPDGATTRDRASPVRSGVPDGRPAG